MTDSAVHPHTVGPAPTNSCSSVSDLSEAISDMSLSTSPGSDPPTSVSSGNVMDIMSTLPNTNSDLVNTGTKNSKPLPRKKRVMRQLSSNPYLASCEMSPDDQLHPAILGANSFAGEPSSEMLDCCPSGGYITSSSSRKSYHVRANSVPLASDFITNSDDDSDPGVDDRNELPLGKHQTRYFNGNPATTGQTYFMNNGSNYEDLSFNHESFDSIRDGRDISTSFQYHQDRISQAGVESFPRITYQPTHNHNNPEMAPNLNPGVNAGSHRYFSYNPVPSPKVEHSSDNVFPIPTSESSPPSQSHFTDVHLRREKDRYHATNLYHDQPRSREINSWGHFSKHTERHYKYRRSHCNSSDSDDESQRYYKNRSLEIPLPSESSHSQSHSPSLHYSRHKSQPSTAVVSNSIRAKAISKNQNEVRFCEKLTDCNGTKPPVFKERFQVMQRWFAECNDGQKNVILKGLLKLCELPQLHLLSVHMSRELHHGCPSNCEDILTWLPTQLATKVMTYLDPVSLCRAAQVCSVWRSLAEDQSLWRRFCCQAKWRLSKAAEHKQVISHMSAEGSIQWKNVFAERFRLRNNWLKGRRTVRTFEGHHQGISCVQFDDSRIVSGSSDKTIKVWNMRTNAPWSVQTLMGHHGTVRCLHLEGNRLVSGSCDTTIKVWDLSTEESWSSIACKVTMTGHSDTVRCLQADDDKVISGSYDRTLKIWDLKSGELRQTLRGHQASVLCVHFSETKIVSGSVDKTIKVWNYEGCCVNTLCGHQDAVTCLMFDATRIVSGSLDHNLKFWDVHSGECLNTIDWKMAEGHTGVVRCLQADSWRVVSAGDDKTIKVWNLATGERLVTLRDHTDGVTCLQFNDFIIVSGSYDTTVKLWDFSCC